MANREIEPAAWVTMQETWPDRSRDVLTNRKDAEEYERTCYELTPLYRVPVSPWQTGTPPYDVNLLVEFGDASDPVQTVAAYVEQPIVNDKPHGIWFLSDGSSLIGVNRWMEIPA